MEEKEIIVIPTTENISISNSVKAKRIKVAAYARVSTSSDEQINSIEMQKLYYENYIKEHKDWEFVGIYADEGISGTSMKNREEFKRIIADATAGKIDLILTKSISRFARNTVDTLQYTRLLKEHGVAIYFEKENINSTESTGEFMLTLLSSLAQEESRSMSENVKWGKRKAFAKGKYGLAYSTFLGYDKGPDGGLVINPEQAEIVRLIYLRFITGTPLFWIIKELNESNIPSPGNKKWHISTVVSILKNEKYKGDALLQKTYVEDFLTKKSKKNEGELTQYYIKNDHEAIVSKCVWNLAQERFRNCDSGSSYVSNFSYKIICGCCGGHYQQKTRTKTNGEKAIFYACESKANRTNKCSNIYVYEDILRYLLTLYIQKHIIEFPDVLDIVKKAISKTIKNKARLKIITESLNEGWKNTISNDNIYLLFKSITVNPDSTLFVEMFDGATETLKIKRKKKTPKKPCIKFIGKMPEETVNQILVLRARGYGYKKIATELNISKNTVASFFRRKKP